ncbi:MAG: gamma carbonic anhydrase family protein [Candidatus Thorarchaeota archaeon]|nr:gamma carbonic anhydrase family protein [Candidatus Thorarchaeota archaeon]
MAVYEFEGRVPIVGNDTYVSDSASVIGRVTLGSLCYVAPGAVIKGDYGEIQIGNGCSVQDNVVVHARPGERTVIGDDVTLGHGCIIHNATVRSQAVIGMGAVVSDYAEVGEWSVVGEGAVVTARTKIPDGKIAIGVPAKVVGDVQEHHKKELSEFKRIYRDLAMRYPKGLRRVR